MPGPRSCGSRWPGSPPCCWRLKASGWREEQLWAAGAISLSSLAGATMAVWRRREGWAFAAALGVNLAASLVVWHFHYRKPFADWWITLIQANAIASATAALVWLAARRRYQLRDLRISSGPLLALQTMLGVAASAALIVMHAVWMIGSQDLIGDFLSLGCAPAGWPCSWLRPPPLGTCSKWPPSGCFTSSAAWLWRSYRSAVVPRCSGSGSLPSCTLECSPLA